MDDSIIQVYLSNGTCNNVRYNERTSVNRIIDVMVQQLGGRDADTCHYALRLVREPRALPADTHWLHKSTSMRDVLKRFPNREGYKWRYELRVRFLPSNLHELYHTQRPTFHFFFEQVRNDYLAHVAERVDESTALELGCLEIRRLFKDMQSSALEKKSNLQCIEEDIGLNRFFPSSVIEANKPKVLRKKIQSHFKKLNAMTESECMFRFLDTLSRIARYDIEIFKASIGDEWKNAVEVVVGPDVGLCYIVPGGASPTKLADFMHICEIVTRLPLTAREREDKSTVSFRISGTSEPLLITCPNMAIGESLAHLVEGYALLMTQTQYTLWTQKPSTSRDDSQSTRTESHSSSSLPRPRATSTRSLKSNLPNSTEHHPSGTQSARSETLERKAVPTISKKPPTTDDADDPPPVVIDEDHVDYATPLNRHYHVNREDVLLEELLGEGQFGDVYKGTLKTEKVSDRPVAVKTCKVESEPTHGENFLEEAYVMQQFSHDHIIKLLGVCLESPIWIVMELAAYGELRQYLINNKTSMDAVVLVDFCRQLSLALAYLEEKKFVHRDIAARNCLVSTPTSIKLSDFGLCRWVEKDAFYTATKGKLPIKWMAPESINFRRFTSASDVWMFGVCMWEISMYGVKPFAGIRNADVIHRLEAGERLPPPTDSAIHPAVYNICMQCWQYEPHLRPTMQTLSLKLGAIVDNTADLNNTIASSPRRAPQNGAPPPPPPKPSTSYGNGMNETSGDDMDQRRRSHRGSQGQVRFADELPSSSDMSRAFDLQGEQLSSALQRQRLQCDRDDEWLRGMEEPLANQQRPSANQHGTSSNQQRPSTNQHRPLTNEPSPSKTFTDIATSPMVEDGVRESTITWSKYTIPPGMRLHRDDDFVYLNVLEVVRSVTLLSKALPDCSSDEFVSHVKRVGECLRDVLTATNGVLHSLSPNAADEIRLAEKVLSTDLHKLVAAMRRALEYTNTAVDTDHNLAMLSNAHVLALDCKHFLEAVDSARCRCGVARFVADDAPRSNGRKSPSPLVTADA